jgi:hypothetical protein
MRGERASREVAHAASEGLRPGRISLDHVKGVTAFFTDEAERRGVLRDNTVSLMPRLKSA